MREAAENLSSPSARPCETRRSSSDDCNAFESTYDIYGSFVRAMCRRMLRDPAEAEDVTQEVFLRVFLKLHTFRGESAFSSWLYRLAKNQVLMWLRKNSRQIVSIDAFQREDGSLLLEVGDPGRQVCDMPEQIDLQAAINGLPKGYREVFVLYDVQGYNHKEIATIFGFSVGNSKSQLHKARKRLREQLGATHSRMNSNVTR